MIDEGEDRKESAADPGFPDRLKRHMDQQGITIAEMARRVWGTMVDERGYTVAKNRQMLSKYLRGKTEPSGNTRRLIADALGVSYHDLFPSDDPVNRPGSGITMTMIGEKKCRLDLHVIVPVEVATEVLGLVTDYAR